MQKYQGGGGPGPPLGCAPADINEPNQPITLALADDVMNFISSITREGMKSKCLFWQSKSHCIEARIWFLMNLFDAETTKYDSTCTSVGAPDVFIPLLLLCP